jgi:hypothetical protein
VRPRIPRGTGGHGLMKVLAEFYSYATFICCNFIGNRRVFKNDYITEVSGYSELSSQAGIKELTLLL